MRTKIKSFKLVLIGLIFISISTIQCNLFEKEEDPASPDYGIQIYPENNATIWGYQLLVIFYNSEMDIQVSDVKIVQGELIQSLIRDNNPLRNDPGEFNIEIDVESITEPNIQIIVEFADGVAEPINYNYSVNHMPIINVIGEFSGGMAYLDASTSVDPEGQPLTFMWESAGTVYFTSEISIPMDQLLEQPVFISVTDGTAKTNDLVKYNPTLDEVMLVKNGLRCINMDIAKDGQAMLEGITTLGPTIAAGDTLPVGADLKLTRDFKVGYCFEVRATLNNSNDTLDEGQDIARTFGITHNGVLVTFVKKGLRRKESNRSELEPGQVRAPYPTTIPPPANTVMVEDSYDNHPRPAFYRVNTATGIEIKSSNSKALGRYSNVSYIVWSDQPGISLRRGTDISKGAFYKAYFRSWMIPDLTLCEKYYTVEIVIDSTGVVTKNELIVLQ